MPASSVAAGKSLEANTQPKRRLPAQDAHRSVKVSADAVDSCRRPPVRASGTEPVIRVMGEGDNLDLVERVVDDICAALTALAHAA
jgi:phosphoglucosamine mutase